MKASVIVCGASPTGLAVVRALGSRGVRVHVADYQGDRPAFFSRYRTGEAVTGATDRAVIDGIIELARREPQPPVAIATSDAFVLALVEHQARLAPHVRLSPSTTSGLAAAITDKRDFHELCEKAGIVTPRTSFPANLDELLDEIRTFQFPLILKPILGHLWRERLRGQKLLEIASPGELHQALRDIGDDVGGLMVQELIPGAEAEIWVAAMYRGMEGQHSRCFVGRKLRQYPPRFGSASFAESRMEPEVARLSWEFLDAVDYRGICGTEFKRDPRDGQLKMIEVNPRPTLWFHLALAAGVDVLHAAYADLAGLAPEPEPRQVDGTRWCFLEKDLLTWPHHLKTRDVPFGSLLSALSPRNHGAVASTSDMRPLFSSVFYYMRRIRERMRSRGAANRAAVEVNA